MILSRMERKRLCRMMFAFCLCGILLSTTMVIGVDAEMTIYSSTGSGTSDDPYTDRFSAGIDPNSFTELDGKYFVVGTDFALKMTAFYTMSTDCSDFARMTDENGSTYYMGILSDAETISFTFEYFSSSLEKSTISIYVVEAVTELVFSSDPVTEGVYSYKEPVSHPDNKGSGTLTSPYYGTVYDPEDGSYVYASSTIVFDYGAGEGAYLTKSTNYIITIIGLQAKINTDGNYSIVFTIHNADGSVYKTIPLYIVKTGQSSGGAD